MMLIELQMPLVDIFLVGEVLEIFSMLPKNSVFPEYE